MSENLNSTKNTERNKIQGNLIENALTCLKNKIKYMSKNEIEIEQPDKIVDIAEKVLDCNKRYQEGRGLKILIPNQMLSTLPITLAQLQAGNNSGKLKNEIRQLLYFLLCSKKLTKTIYNNLINAI